MATTEIDSLRFEVGLSSTPLTALASVTWTDVKADVMLSEGVSFNRGRQSADDAPSPGSLTLTLNNGQRSGVSVGRWTLGGSNMTAGWALRVPIRVRHATYGVIWLGYVDSMEAGWADGVRPVVRVRATDRLARFARRTLVPLSIGTMLASDPIALYPLDEPAGATAAGDRTASGRPPLTIASVGGTGTSLVEFGSTAAPDLSGATSLGLTQASSTVGRYLTAELSEEIAVPLVGSVGGWTIEALVSKYGAATASEPIFSLRGADGRSHALAWSTTDTITFDAPFSSLASSAVSRDTWHHVALVVGLSAPGSILYIDGAVAATGAATSSHKGSRLDVGGCPDYVGSGYEVPGAAFSGNIALVAVYPTELSAATVADHAKMLTGFVGDTAAARWQRICASTGIDAADYALDGGILKVPNTPLQVPSMGPQDTTGRSFLDAAQECADVEGGVSFLAKTGVLTFQRGATRFNATVATTLGPADIDAATSVAFDTDRLVNDITVSRPGGATRRVVNAASIAAYDSHTKSMTLPASDDDQGVGIAEWIVYESGEPSAARIDSIAVDLVAKAATVSESALIGADVSSRIQLTSMPTPSAPSATVDLFVEGISDSITPSSWVRTFATSSATKASGVFIIGDATWGRVTTGGVLA